MHTRDKKDETAKKTVSSRVWKLISLCDYCMNLLTYTHSEGGREEWREGGRERGMEGRRNGGMEGGMEGGVEGWRDGEREGGMEVSPVCSLCC